MEVPDLPEHELALMSEEERQEYYTAKEEVATYKATLKEAKAHHDPYYHGFRVIDTDYDNWLITYSCDEDHDDDEKLMHNLAISILVRDPDYNIKSLIDLLKQKVPSVKFDKTHGWINHECPEGDLFLLPDAIKTDNDDYNELDSMFGDGNFAEGMDFDEMGLDDEEIDLGMMHDEF